MEIKLIKSIKIIAIIIATLFLISAIWFGWENLNHVRKSTNQLDESINNVIIEWSADYANDTALLQQIDEDLSAAQARLEALGVEFD